MKIKNFQFLIDPWGKDHPQCTCNSPCPDATPEASLHPRGKPVGLKSLSPSLLPLEILQKAGRPPPSRLTSWVTGLYVLLSPGSRRNFLLFTILTSEEGILSEEEALPFYSSPWWVWKCQGQDLVAGDRKSQMACLREQEENQFLPHRGGEVWRSTSTQGKG